MRKRASSPLQPAPRIRYSCGRTARLEMGGCNLSADLLHLARSVVEAATRTVETGGSAVHAALLASQLYEALKVELEASRRPDAAKIGRLPAAVRQCRRAPPAD